MTVALPITEDQFEDHKEDITVAIADSAGVPPERVTVEIAQEEGGRRASALHLHVIIEAEDEVRSRAQLLVPLPLSCLCDKLRLSSCAVALELFDLVSTCLADGRCHG